MLGCICDVHKHIGYAGGVSGVIAVVVFGLYGSATGRWHMSPRVVESGAFEIFWDTVVFAFNGLIFFFAGASSINFFWRSSQVSHMDLGSCQSLVAMLLLHLNAAHAAKVFTAHVYWKSK